MYENSSIVRIIAFEFSQNPIPLSPIPYPTQEYSNVDVIRWMCVCVFFVVVHIVEFSGIGFAFATFEYHSMCCMRSKERQENEDTSICMHKSIRSCLFAHYYLYIWKPCLYIWYENNNEDFKLPTTFHFIYLEINLTPALYTKTRT